MKLSLAITTFCRYELTKESFAQVIDDPRIDDIVILDDASTDGSFEKLAVDFKGHEKVRVIMQAQNRGMSRNKTDAVAHAKNDFVILFDSDNVIGKDYLDALEKAPFYDYAILCPVFARPQFDFRKYAGQTISRQDAKYLIRNNDFNVAMNCCNYVVPREQYLKAYKYDKNHVCTDTAWFNYNWLEAGNVFHFVEGMEYFHRVHKGSGFLQNVDYNMKRSEEVRRLIAAL